MRENKIMLTKSIKESINEEREELIDNWDMGLDFLTASLYDISDKEMKDEINREYKRLVMIIDNHIQNKYNLLRT
jgi:hypothetical protein